jgi:addiction module RelB/DinJ family antitoxin
MTTTLTIKTDKKLRDAAKRTAQELGVPLTTILNALMRQFVRDKEITLCSHAPNAETKRAMLQAKERKNLEEFASFAEWKKSMSSS